MSERKRGRDFEITRGSDQQINRRIIDKNERGRNYKGRREKEKKRKRRWRNEIIFIESWGENKKESWRSK